jgi:hypothetical protein
LNSLSFYVCFLVNVRGGKASSGVSLERFRPIGSFPKGAPAVELLGRASKESRIEAYCFNHCS